MPEYVLTLILVVFGAVCSWAGMLLGALYLNRYGMRWPWQR